MYVTTDGTAPSFTNYIERLTYTTPYLHVDTPFQAGRHRVVRAVAAEVFPDG